jgi:class 3 adenylate cyclase
MRHLHPSSYPGYRPALVLAFLLWAVSIAAIVGGLLVWWDRGFPEHPASYVSGPLGIAGITVAGIAYATAGLWLVGHAPRNLLGWVVLSAGAGLAAVLILNQYIEASIHPFRPVPDDAIVLAWVSGALHLPVSAAAAVIALLVFPSGRVEWAPMKVTMVLAAVGCGFLVVGTALYPDGQLWYPTLPPPVDVPEALRPLSQPLTMVGMLLFVPTFALAAVGLGWRIRRSSPEQRRPLVWVTVGGSVMAVTLSVLFVGRYAGMADDDAGDRLTLLAGLGAVVLPLTLIRYFNISESAGIPVRDVTFLFTDLADSAAMYRRIGDRSAFDLVRLHFDTIRSVTKAHNGVVVKTIGDAIMAAFTRPSDAVATAFEMFERIGELNERRDAELVLKIGVQRGPAILVGSRDHPDYFGQTVNAAARLQAAAHAGEICLSNEVLVSPGVAEVVAGREVLTEVASLRGVTDDTIIHRVRIMTKAARGPNEPDQVGEAEPAGAVVAEAPAAPIVAAELERPAAH